MVRMYGKPTRNSSYLTDRFGRMHNYLRLSITENCNFRCSYCMPEEHQHSSLSDLLTPAEIEKICRIFTGIGIDKIRLTGGEPLARKDFSEIISRLDNIPATLALTTNGILLDKYIPKLKETNFSKINISLDSLQSEKFRSITKRDSFQKVYDNIFKAVEAGFDVKVNAVIMKGVNDDELVDFARLTINNPITVRFIEFMPFNNNNWSFGRIVKQNTILETLQNCFDIENIDVEYSSTAQLYKISKSKGHIGIISTVSHPFCDSCNRLRLTSDGKLKSCLFGKNELDLLTPLRNNEDLLNSIQNAINKKPLQHGGKQSIKEKPSDIRNMYSIGG